MNSKFRKWFKEQYGYLPIPEKQRLELLDRINRARERLACMERLHEQDSRMRDRLTAALYAYNAFGGEK